MKPSGKTVRRILSLEVPETVWRRIEILLLVAGLATTVVFSYKSTQIAKLSYDVSERSYEVSKESYTLAEVAENEARENFRLERTTTFAARFDDPTFIHVRTQVDRWADSGESVTSVLKRFDAGDPQAAILYDNLRTYANFFQELDIALENDTLNEHYAWDIFGNAAQRADERLDTYIVELRPRYRRPGLLEGVKKLAARMRSLDNKFQRPNSTIPLASARATTVPATIPSTATVIQLGVKSASGR